MADRPPPHDTPAGPNPDVRNLSVEVLSDNWYTLRLATFEHRQPDGSWEVEQREAYDRGNGVVALLHDPEHDTVLLVRQYRAPAHLNGHPDGMLLEAPAGLLDGDEGAEEAMRRELAEEVGHDVADLRRRFRLYMSPGSVTEHLTFFTGTYRGSDGSGGGGMADEGEQIDIVEVTVADAVAMIADGRIVDAKTVILLQQLQLDRR
jgi:nudix-type nucleoside diphosphatase (YffH/AdpP family)